MRTPSIPALRLQKELEKQILPAYLLLGPDTYLKEHAIDLFVQRLSPELRDFNVSHFEHTEMQACLDAARTLPMMAPRRVIVLEDISRLNDADWEALYAYLEDANERTALLLVAEKLHEARVKKIAKRAAVISIAEPSLAEARSLAEKSLRKEGYRFEPAVIDELLDQTGTSLRALVQALEKVKLYRLQEKTISPGDVAALSNRVRPHQIWDLTDQIATRNRRQVLLLLHRMLEDGAVPLVLAKTIYSHFAGLLAVKELAGNSEAAISETTGWSPYYVRRLVEQARKFEISELRAALAALHRTDSSLKGSRGLSEKLLLESLMIRILAR